MRSVTLGAVCEFKPSKRLARASLSETDAVSFVPMNELGIHQMHLAPHEQRSLSEVIGAYTYFADGDVLLAKITPCFENGKLGVARGLTNGVGFGSSEFMVIRPNGEILPEYLYYFLERDEVRLTGAKIMTGAVGHKRVPQEFIESLEITLPSLDEQRRIVAALDEAFAAIATATANVGKNLTNARELFQNALGAGFADLASSAPKRSIGEIANIKGGKRVPKGYKMLGEPTPYPYLTVGDFTDDGTIDPSGVRYVSEEIHKQIKRYIVRSTDLYVSIAGTIGRTGIVPPEYDGAHLTENACRLVFKDGILNKFVYFFTKSASFRSQAIDQTRTAAQPKLALSRLEQITLPIPAPDEQKIMVDRFSKIQNFSALLTEQALRKLELLADLKQSLLRRAFTSELAATMPETIAA